MIFASSFAIEIHDTIIRRCLARRFPYGVLYFMEQGDILILAVMHLHRSPDYWKARIQ
jgi:hypothetical protein